MSPYEEGKKAYRDGKYHLQNPYTFNSYEYHCWKDGYFDATYEDD
jgi:hypothetical protein